jgi:Trypsin
MTSGWGYTLNDNESDQFLRAVEITTVDQIACNNTYTVHEIEITDQMVCAADKGKDACTVSSIFIPKFFKRGCIVFMF